jgi:sigma-B regulation protein RsbU (phosphoserine phosphatase)
MLLGNAIESERQAMPPALVCGEVRGGNSKFLGERVLPGITAWIACIPASDQGVGGDLHFMSSCDHDLISRVALADVSGHGYDVDTPATDLFKLMRKNINTWDQTEFMRGVNEAFRESGAGKYATAIILSLHRLTGRLAFTNAGHLPPMWYHSSENNWGFLEEGDPSARRGVGLPVGLIHGTDYVQTIVSLRKSDFLVLYTDGITEATDDNGRELGPERLLEWARHSPNNNPTSLGEALLGRFSEFRANRQNDDETLIVLQRNGEATISALLKVMHSNTWGRLLRNFGLSPSF